MKIFKATHNGLESCTNFCFNGANGESILKSTCTQAFIGTTKFSCAYKRRDDISNVDELPLITCYCQEPLKYELQFEDNQKRLRQPLKDKILNILSWNYQYVTLDFVDYKSELVLDGTKICQNDYLYLPDGWEVAPNDKVTLSVIEQYSFSGAHYIILSDFNAYLTKLGRSEAFKRSKGKTLWKEIEGRIVDGNDIVMSNSTLRFTLEQCKDLCAKDILCKALQFPHCQLKTSTDTNKLDESFQFSTYIKLNVDTSIGIPLQGNPDGLFVKYYDSNYGLKVPDAYCPGRILLRKIRRPFQCENVNGHWYELIYSEKVTYENAKNMNSLYWRGVKGQLAVITSKEEQSCIQQLICEMDIDEQDDGDTLNEINNNIAWIGAEKIGNEYKWMVPDTDEYNTTFIDVTQNIILGMYAPEIAKWESYQKMLQETGNSGDAFHAITICNNDNWNWNIENKNNKHFFLIEYETPIECDESDTVFEILGPSMQYYYAEEIASKQTWFGNKGYLGTIINEKEEKCVERLGFCGIDKVWAAGSDNTDNVGLMNGSGNQYMVQRMKWKNYFLFRKTK